MRTCLRIDIQMTVTAYEPAFFASSSQPPHVRILCVTHIAVVFSRDRTPPPPPLSCSQVCSRLHIPELRTSTSVSSLTRLLPLFVSNNHIMSKPIQCNQAVSKNIRDALQKRAGDFGIVMEDTAITHLSFSREYTAAVEAKQVGASVDIGFVVGASIHSFIHPSVHSTIRPIGFAVGRAGAKPAANLTLLVLALSVRLERPACMA